MKKYKPKKNREMITEIIEIKTSGFRPSLFTTCVTRKCIIIFSEQTRNAVMLSEITTRASSKISFMNRNNIVIPPAILVEDKPILMMMMQH